MRIPDDILSFLAAPVTILVGGRGAGFAPEIARGVGLCPGPGDDCIDVMISAWQWPGTVANLRDNGALALTVSDPRSYRTYQLKGTARLQPPTAACQEAAAAYVQQTLAMFDALAMPAGFAGHWLSLRDLVVARLTVEEIYIQTPGPTAGQRADAGTGAAP